MAIQSIILDASTLILLAKTDLLQIWVSSVHALIPEVVRREATVKPDVYDAQLIARLVKDGKIHVERDRSFHEFAKGIEKQFRLGAGESAALALAKEKQCALATDDGVAIKAAKILEIPFITTLHILAVLCDEGRLDARTALAKLDLLETFGRYGALLIDDVRARIKKERG